MTTSLVTQKNANGFSFTSAGQKYKSKVSTGHVPSGSFRGESVPLPFQISRGWDFPGGPVVKNLPSNTGDVGSISGWGTKIPHAAGQLSPCATTTEPTRSGAREPQLEKKKKPSCHN